MKTCPVCDTDYPDHHTACPTDGAVLIGSKEFEPGRLVRGKYRIVRQIGQGGMGVVYKADDLLLGVPVALKFLKGDLGKDPRFIKRFRTEARAAYQLRHANIVEVTSLDQDDDGSLFIAMECVEGSNLRVELDQAPAGFAVRRALEIGRDIASGLAAAHRRGIVHRDIKPENILLGRASDGKEQPKIVDFGIVAVTESVTHTNLTHGLLLTREYAAPEQWLQMPASEIDGRTDLYALGCVMYEMLTGRPPFHAHNPPEWMQRHLHEQPTPPSRVRPELAAWKGLDALAVRLMAKDRGQRPRDANEVESALAALANAAPAVVTGPGSTILEKNLDPTARLDTKPPSHEIPVPGFKSFEEEKARPFRLSRVVVMVLAAVVVIAAAATFAWNQLHPAPDTAVTGTPLRTDTGGPPPPGTATISITCDAVCDWFVDGRPEGKLNPGKLGQAKVDAGRHQISTRTTVPGFEQAQPRQIALAAGEAYRTDFTFAKKTNLTDEGRPSISVPRDSTPPPPQTDAIDKLYAQCIARQNEGDNTGALAACNRAVALDPHGLYPRTSEVTSKRNEIRAECKVNNDPCGE